jgi:PAS domain S-box-containing protein
MASDADADLHELFEHSPCGMLSALPDGTIVRVNTTLLEWLGRTRESVIGTRFQSLLTVPGRIFHDTHYAPLLAMQGSIKEIALDLARDGKPPLAMLVSTVVRRDRDGRITRLLTTLCDSSDRRTYERELLRARQDAERAVRAKEALLSTISHEMRSPLSASLMAVELLLGKQGDAGDQRYLRVIERSSNTVLDLVNAILDHSKLELGALTWQESELDLFTLLDEIAAIAALKAEAKQIRFVMNRDDRMPHRVRTDGFKLGMVLTNLLSNATKFTAQGSVTLDVRLTERIGDIAVVQFSVSDTGIGIEREALATIFDEYQQATLETAARYGGTGLGLAIVRKALALTASKIDVSSELGRGSRFSFELRLSAIEATRAAS